MIYNIKFNIDFDNINNMAFSLCDASDYITFKFESKIFANPSGISMLSSLMNFKDDLISIDYDLDRIGYLLRMNFFKNLGHNIPENFKRHDARTNMLECTKILSDDDPYVIDIALKEILNSHIRGKRDLVYGILLTTYEITDNILEHSANGEFKQSDRIILNPGFVAAQYYPKDDKIEIGISDSGEGIVNTLAPAYPLLTREEVLLESFKLNRTRHIKLMPTRGNGLAKLKHFVLSTHGSIRCRTNEFAIIFNKDFPDGFIKKVDPVIGTHFEIIICCGNNIDIKPIFNASYEDYEDTENSTISGNDELDDFFN